MIVEVVLASHLGALCLEHSSQCVTDSSPAGATQVNRARRVCRDKLKVQLDPGQVRTAPIALAGFDDCLGKFAGRRSAQRDVDETWASHINLGNFGLVVKLSGEQIGKIPRFQVESAGHLHCHIGCPIPVFPILGALNDHLGG